AAHRDNSTNLETLWRRDFREQTWQLLRLSVDEPPATVSNAIARGMRHHAFAVGNGGSSACSRKADPRALLGAGSTRQLLVHEHYRSRIPDHCPADRSQGNGNLECRVFPGIPR